MSREVKATPKVMSIDPQEVPAGMMALTFHVPLAEAENLQLGSPVTLVLPEAKTATVTLPEEVAARIQAGNVGGMSISEKDPAAAALRAAADLLEAHPPMTRTTYVGTLRLLADEPWRLDIGTQILEGKQ